MILPQGRYAELLTARDGDRRKILNELFRLDQFSELQRLAKEMECSAAAELGAGERERRRLPEDPHAALAAAQEGCTRTTEALAAVQRTRAAADELVATLATEETELVQLTEQRRVLTGAEPLLAQLRDLEERSVQLEARIAKEQRQLDAAREEKRTAEAEHAALQQNERDGETLQRAERALQTIVRELREIENGATERAEIDAALERILIDGKEANTKERTARESVQAARAQAERAETELASARSTLVELERVLGHRHRLAQTIQQHERELAQARVQREQAQHVEEHRRAELGVTQEEAAAARAAHERAALANHAVALAAHLHPGDACPVCRQTLPENLVPPREQRSHGGRRSRARRERERGSTTDGAHPSRRATSGHRASDHAARAAAQR